MTLIHMPAKTQDYWGDGSYFYSRSAYDLIGYRYIHAGRRDRVCASCENVIPTGDPYLRCFAIEPCVDTATGRDVRAPKMIVFHIACGVCSYLNSDVPAYVDAVEEGRRKP